MMSLFNDKQAVMIEAFKTTSRYLDDILKVSHIYIDNMVCQIYPAKLKL